MSHEHESAPIAAKLMSPYDAGTGRSIRRNYPGSWNPWIVQWLKYWRATGQPALPFLMGR